MKGLIFPLAVHNGNLQTQDDVHLHRNCRKNTHPTLAGNESQLVTSRNEVVAKVMFLLVSVILLTGEGVCLSACWDTAPFCQGDPPGGRPPCPLPRRPSLPRRPIAKETPLPSNPPRRRHPPLQTHTQIRSRSTPKAHTQGEIEGDQIQAHTQGGN